MAGPSWLFDKNRIATKIKSANAACEPILFKSNPSKACPNCQYVIDNSDVEWPGFPRGVKFDPSDQDIIWHLLTKVGVGTLSPHPFIDEFIPTVNEDDGICYTHPRKLPGVKQDGSVSHFFHRAIKAYNTGTRKRRKIQDGDLGDVRWHKTGRTKPVFLGGAQKGCKKIMVLYVNPAKGGKAEKTNWVMHQYHLGTEEDEREGEYVVSKVFYQQQQVVRPSEKNVQEECPGDFDAINSMKVDPVTPKSVTPEPPITERRVTSSDAEYEPISPIAQDQDMGLIQDDILAALELPDDQDHIILQNNFPDHIPSEKHSDQVGHEISKEVGEENFEIIEEVGEENHADQVGENNDNEAGEDPKWWDSESQHLLSSQQLVEALSLCDDLLQSQSPKRNKNGDQQELKCKPSLSDYARLGPEQFKKDLEECQHVVLNPADIDLDTCPDVRLSQLEFVSQDSYIAWGGSRMSSDARHQGHDNNHT